MILDGVFGTNPAIYDRLFKRFGEISETTYTPTNLDETVKKGRTAILCYYYVGNNGGKGFHYINMTWDGEKYQAVNSPDKEFVSIDKFFSNRENGKRTFISLTTIY